jgi:hypothetical protein
MTNVRTPSEKLRLARYAPIHIELIGGGGKRAPLLRAAQQIGDPETTLKLEQGARRAVVADPSLGAGGVEDQIGVAQQALDR